MSKEAAIPKVLSNRFRNVPRLSMRYRNFPDFAPPHVLKKATFEQWGELGFNGLRDAGLATVTHDRAGYVTLAQLETANNATYDSMVATFPHTGHTITHLTNELPQQAQDDFYDTVRLTAEAIRIASEKEGKPLKRVYVVQHIRRNDKVDYVRNESFPQTHLHVYGATQQDFDEATRPSRDEYYATHDNWNAYNDPTIFLARDLYREIFGEDVAIDYNSASLILDKRPIGTSMAIPAQDRERYTEIMESWQSAWTEVAECFTDFKKDQYDRNIPLDRDTRIENIETYLEKHPNLSEDSQKLLRYFADRLTSFNPDEVNKAFSRDITGSIGWTYNFDDGTVSFQFAPRSFGVSHRMGATDGAYLGVKNRQRGIEEQEREDIHASQRQVISSINDLQAADNLGDNAGISQVFVLPTQVSETRLALLPQTLKALEEKGVVMRRTLPIVSPPNQEQGSYAHWLSVAYRDSALQPTLMAEVDIATTTEARQLLSQTNEEQGEVLDSKVWDVITVGTGWGGVLTSERIHAHLPDAEIVSLDNKSSRGGHFRDKGINYPFNSPTTGENSGLPGEMNGPNNLGHDVLLQIGELTDDPFPRKKVAGDAIAINGFFEGPAITNADVTQIIVTNDPNRPYIVEFTDKETGQTKKFYSRAVALAPGQGTPKWGFDIDKPETQAALNKYPENIFMNDDFREHLNEMSTMDIFQMVSNGLAFGGGRDGTNTAIRYIITRLREKLTDDQIQKLSVNVFGAHYESADDFSEVMGTNVYDDLIPFIGSFIRPRKEKITGLYDDQNSLSLHLDNRFFGLALAHTGTFVASAGYTDAPLQNLLETIQGGKKQPVLENVMGVGELEGQTIARKVTGEKIFVIGVAARDKKPKTKGKSLRSFGRAIRKHAPRVLQTADRISHVLQEDHRESYPVLSVASREKEEIQGARKLPTAQMPMVIITGPNGAGKSTITGELMSKPELPLTPFVRHTSRTQGPQEVDGRDYNFVTPGEFDAMQQDGAFIHQISKPWGAYGESRATLERLLGQENIVLFQLALDSATGLRDALITEGIQPITFFVTPAPVDIFLADQVDSIATLRRRMQRRGRGETPTELFVRLEAAKNWLSSPPPDMLNVVNRDGGVEEAVGQIQNVLLDLVPA